MENMADGSGSSELPTVDIHDRIADAYYGKMGARFQRETQKRIHWVCENVAGRNVLDVGCSQGITDILLAREGVRVKTIDTDAEAIAAAESLLAAESTRVRENLSFGVQDFLSLAPGEKFDTVIIAEVLEHLLQPQAFVEAAANRLDAGGRLVITVPFGVNDFIDHKHTFYLFQPYQLVSRFFEVDKVVLLGKWIGIAATRRSGELESPLAVVGAELLQSLEDAFEAQERALLEDLSATRGRLNDANLKYRQSTEQLAQLKQRLAQEENLRKASETELKVHTGTAQDLQARLAAAEASLGAQAEAGANEISALHTRLLDAEKSLAVATAQLDVANQKYRESTERYAQLKARVQEAESQRSELQQQLSLLQAEATHFQEGLEAERAARQQETAALQSEINAQANRYSQAQLQLVKAETLLEGMQEKLALANQRHRDVHERVQQLEQCLQQEEAVRQKQADEKAALERSLIALLHDQEKKTLLAEASGSAIHAQLDAANLKYRESTERYTQLKEKLQHETSALTAARAQIDRLQSDLHAVQRESESEREAWSASAQASLSRIEELQIQHQAAQTRLVEREAAVDQLQAELAEARQLLDQAVLDNQALAAEKQQLAEHLSQSREEQAQLQGEFARQIAQQQQTIAGLDEELAQTLNTLAASTDSIAEAELARASLSADLAEAEQELRSTSEALRVLQAEFAATCATLDAERSASGEAREELLLSLNRANAKYRAATEQYAELKARADAQADELARLQSANAELLMGREALASELETVRAAQRSEEQQAGQLKLAVLQGKRALASMQTELELLRQQKIAAENQVTKTRGMISFRLGYALINGFKSFAAFSALPGQLLEIHRDAKQRKAKKIGGAIREQPPSPALRVGTTSPSATKKPVIPATQLIRELSDPAQALKSLKVAGIMDEFTYHSYAPECSLLQLSVSHWQQELESYQPELLFIESAWRGKDDQWGSKVGHMSEELQGIVNWCRQHKVPTIFWNKEDPVHFETFLSTARLFDYVFTTDIDCIHRYKAALGHEQVYLLPFACQPQSNNPVEKYERKDAFCFAGAYYVRYPERTRDLGNFVSALADYRPVEIYDRNFGKDDPNYQFPPEYQPFIVGNLPYEQIDKAYKGYRYAINLNSIKQSQSMFARRVFELLACNTITVSNFSRGVRLMFGDLVITTDSGTEIVRRLQAHCDDDLSLRKFRLAGLRKVMQHHTYQDRLAYVVSRVQGKPLPSLLPAIVVTAYAKNQAQFDSILASYERQTHADRRLLLVVPASFAPQTPAERDDISIVTAEAAQTLITDCVGAREWIAGMVPDDYYGPNYLLDLALATRYSGAGVIGKKNHFVWSAAKGLAETYPAAQYRPHPALPARAAMIAGTQLAETTLREWATSLYVRQLEAADALAIDEFNYCKNGQGEGFGAEQVATINDLEGLDAGLPAQEIIQRAEQIAPAEASPDEAPVLSGADLARYFKPAAGKPYTLQVSGDQWEAESQLPDGKHEYLYAAQEVSPAELGFTTLARFHFDVTPGLNLQLVLVFLDAQKQRINHVIKTANRNQEAEIPLGTAWIRLGLRIYGSGVARINALVLGHRPLRPADVLGKADTLLLTNHYPAYDDLYRNGFVHTRVAAYAERGMKVDVFRLRAEEGLSWHEFNNVDVITGSAQALHKLLEKGRYQRVLVHFLDPAMWAVLQHHIDRIKVVVWVHGAEIQSYERRSFLYESEDQHRSAKDASERRLAFWRSVLNPMPENLSLVFVSRWLAETAQMDLGVRIPEEKFSIIPNPINTELFAYKEKHADQRKKILSVRPYASKVYANDLSVEAILELSCEPFFNELEFRMVGDGPLFEETLAPLRQFGNVIIERRFMAQEEIAELHQQYGVFLCPTRMDTQGVSRDEAMASGLVPVTNDTAAVPEFCPPETGMLCAHEEIGSLCNSIKKLYYNPQVFLEKSSLSSLEVRKRSLWKVVEMEIAGYW